MMRPLLVLGVQVRQSWPGNMVGDETTIGFGVFRFGFAFLFTVVSSKILVVFPRVINCLPFELDFSSDYGFAK